MLWTGLLAAALLVVQDPVITQTHDTQATTVPPVNVRGPRMESGANTRASDPSQEVICRDQPVTGSRFNQRRCRTRAQAQASAAAAQNTLAEITRGGPSTDAALTGGPSTGPQ